MGHRRLLLAALAAAATHFDAAQASTVSIGIQLPFNDPVECVTAWQYFQIARTAARFIETTDWWQATGTSLRLEVLPAPDSYGAWLSAAQYALGPEPKCKPAANSSSAYCRVFRAGILGPWTSEATQLVQLVTRTANMAQMTYSATDDSLTPDAYKALNPLLLQPFLRVAYTDEMMLGGIWAFIQNMGWQIFTILHARDTHGDNSAVFMADLVQRTVGATASVAAVLSFEAGNRASIQQALGALKAGVPRVVVLFSYADDAAMVLQEAQAAGATGKGWSWLGGEWVREFTWIAASLLVSTNQTASDSAAAQSDDNDDFSSLTPTNNGGGWFGRRALEGSEGFAGAEEDAAAFRRASVSFPTAASVAAQAAKEAAFAEAEAAVAALAAEHTAVLADPATPAAARKELLDWLAAEGRPAAAAALLRGGGATAETAAGGGQRRRVQTSTASSWWGPSASSGLAIPTSTGQVLAAMYGVVGVVPLRIPPDSALGGFLDRFTTDLIADPTFMTLSGAAAPGAFPPPPIPVEAACPLLYNAPTTTVGLPLDLFGPYVFNGVFALAAAAAEVLTGVLTNNGTAVSPLPNVTSAALAAYLKAFGTQRTSPLTSQQLHWLDNGDRWGVSLSLVNVQGGQIVRVGDWASSVRPRTANESGPGVLPAGVRMSDGWWDNMSAIVWPGNVPLVPPDRALQTSATSATALVVALAGIILSLLLGSIVHHAGITALPEAGVTVLVGAGFGVLLRFAFGAAVQNTAEFNQTTFMLLLLPVIIFESGYTMDRRPFFGQLFSICAFAIVGTLLAALVTGGMVWWAGNNGTIAQLSYEEAMSFGSLLSATDPVSVLAIFSTLKVHPTLYALVYGEAVINDAVAIVLYRTFAGFLVTDITTDATLWAVGSFLGVLFLSLFIGLGLGMLATLAFRYVNVTGQGREVRWEREFHARVAAFKRFMPKVPHVKTLDDGAAGLEAAAPLHGSHHHAVAAAAPAAASSPAAAAAASPAAAPASGLHLRHPQPQPHQQQPAASHEHDPKHNAALSPVQDAGDNAQVTLDNVDLLAGIAETAILLLFAYVSFALAEAVELSGIVAALICGVTMNAYTRRVLTRDGKVTSTAVFRMLATLADTCVFFQIGLNVVITLNVNNYNMAFILFTLFGCLVGRAVAVFAVSWLLNMYRHEPIPGAFQLQMWWAGLRGAVAYATALGFPSQHRALVVNATSWICLFTIFAMGGSTTATMTALGVPFGADAAAVEAARVRREQAADRAAAAAAAAAGDMSQAHHLALREQQRAAGGLLERQVKAAMVWLDRWIQRLAYGRRFLREMESANELAELRARQRAARALGFRIPEADLRAMAERAHALATAGDAVDAGDDSSEDGADGDGGSDEDGSSTGDESGGCYDSDSDEDARAHYVVRSRRSSAAGAAGSAAAAAADSGAGTTGAVAAALTAASASSETSSSPGPDLSSHTHHRSQQQHSTAAALGSSGQAAHSHGQQHSSATAAAPGSGSGSSSSRHQHGAAAALSPIDEAALETSPPPAPAAAVLSAAAASVGGGMSMAAAAAALDAWGSNSGSSGFPTAHAPAYAVPAQAPEPPAAPHVFSLPGWDPEPAAPPPPATPAAAAAAAEGVSSSRLGSQANQLASYERAAGGPRAASLALAGLAPTSLLPALGAAATAAAAAALLPVSPPHAAVVGFTDATPPAAVGGGGGGGGGVGFTGATPWQPHAGTQLLSGSSDGSVGGASSRGSTPAAGAVLQQSPLPAQPRFASPGAGSSVSAAGGGLGSSAVSSPSGGVPLPRPHPADYPVAAAAAVASTPAPTSRSSQQQQQAAGPAVDTLLSPLPPSPQHSVGSSPGQGTGLGAPTPVPLPVAPAPAPLPALGSLPAATLAAAAAGVAWASGGEAAAATSAHAAADFEFVAGASSGSGGEADGAWDIAAAPAAAAAHSADDAWLVTAHADAPPLPHATPFDSAWD